MRQLSLVLNPIWVVSRPDLQPPAGLETAPFGKIVAVHFLHGNRVPITT